MIKRIKDHHLSKVKGGGRSDTTCLCSTVCTCKGKMEMKVSFMSYKNEFRNSNKPS